MFYFYYISYLHGDVLKPVSTKIFSTKYLVKLDII